MSERFPRGRTAIVGTATHGIGEAPGLNSMDLAATAGLLALADANLSVADVDALFVCLPDDMLSGLSLAEYLGIQPRMTSNNRTGGSAFLTHAMAAALAIEAGLCNVALITYGANPRTGGGKLVLPPGASIYERPYRVSLAASYALAATRHMLQYGTTRRQLAEVVVAARQWAMLNPEAYLREPLSIDECLAARPVASPFTVRDCCLVCDGGRRRRTHQRGASARLGGSACFSPRRRRSDLASLHCSNARPDRDRGGAVGSARFRAGGRRTRRH